MDQTKWVKSHVLASEKSILIYRNSWKERMAQMTNNKTNSIKQAMKLGDNVKALKMCGLILIYLAWRNLKTGFCHALANFAYPLTACRWFNQLCFELAQLASGDLARQGPRSVSRMIIWIFCSDTSDHQRSFVLIHSLVMMSTSPVSTVIFPKSETAMLSRSGNQDIDSRNCKLSSLQWNRN